MSPKRRHKNEFMDDEEPIEEEDLKDDEDEDEDEGLEEEETIDLEKAKKEEEDEEDDEEEEEDVLGDTVADIERRRIFQHEAEDLLENLTLDDVRDVLKENGLDTDLASRVKKLLAEVISEGEVSSMDEAWAEAFERIED